MTKLRITLSPTYRAKLEAGGNLPPRPQASGRFRGTITHAQRATFNLNHPAGQPPLAPVERSSVQTFAARARRNLEGYPWLY